MKKLRLTINLILILFIVGLTSTGFSLWYINTDVSKTEGGTIFADDVIKSTKYVELKDITYFTYYNTGFLTGKKSSNESKNDTSYNIVLDESNNTYGDITISASLKANDLKNDKNIKNARIKINIDYAKLLNYSMFNDDNIKLTYIAIINNVSSDVKTNSNNEAYFDYDISSIEADIDFSISVKVETSQSYFISTLYNHFNSDTPSFHYSIMVMEVV